HPDLRQLPPPDREHLWRDRRVRLQERRLPRLPRQRLRARPPRPPPQQPRRASPPQDRSRNPPPTQSRQDRRPPQARRLNNERVSGATLREAALGEGVNATSACLRERLDSSPWEARTALK